MAALLSQNLVERSRQSKDLPELCCFRWDIKWFSNLYWSKRYSKVSINTTLNTNVFPGSHDLYRSSLWSRYQLNRCLYFLINSGVKTCFLLTPIRGWFRTLSQNCDEIFLWKEVETFKSFIIDLWPDPKYASVFSFLLRFFARKLQSLDAAFGWEEVTPYELSVLGSFITRMALVNIQIL